jgi:hypothetical protein
LFLGEALLPEEEPGDGLGGVAEEALLLQVGQPALRLQVKFFHPGQQPSEHNSGGFIDTKIVNLYKNVVKTILLLYGTETAQFLFWEYIHGIFDAVWEAVEDRERRNYRKLNIP